MTIPSAEHLCLRLPLYEAVSLEKGDKESVKNLISANMSFDAFCLECGQNSIFHTHRTVGGGARGSTSYVHSEDKTTDQNGNFRHADFYVEMHCSRNPSHTMRFVFCIQNNALTKIGQRPSLADISANELKKYRKLLGNQRSSEIFKAIGLASHGLGIGAFVYLRRVFESLLNDKRQVLESVGTKIDGYDEMRMDEKVLALKEGLPSFLVQNRSLYGILSKGIHELEEDVCLEIFPVVRDSIFIILEEVSHEREAQELRTKLSSGIANLAGKLRQGT